MAHPTSITFLTRSYANELALLNLLKRNHVQCLVVTHPTKLPIEEFKKSGIAIIKVSSVKHAYMVLARFYSSQFLIPRIQVTGSTGKTTTKNMIGSVLEENMRPLTTRGDLNSPLGVAENLLRLEPDHGAVVLEASLKKAPGVMQSSSRLIRPNIGVVTSIQRAHIERFGSIKEIIAAKSAMLNYLSKDGTLIINWDDTNCHKYPIHKFEGRIVRFGFSEECDLWASEITHQGLQTHFTVHAKELIFPAVINTIGKYNVGNALAAIAVGLAMGMDVQAITKGLQHFKPIKGRLKVYQRKDGAVIIDDTYKANPDSTHDLLDELVILAREQPLVLVIGDMEKPFQRIKQYARRVHYEIGQQIAKGDFSHVLTVGLWAQQYYRGAVNAGFPREKLSYFSTVQSARPLFNKLLKPGTVVVLKATYTKLGKLRTKAFTPKTYSL
jgi:UDP-N-acetylmuramyl pentapeptide synthase